MPEPASCAPRAVSRAAGGKGHAVRLLLGQEALVDLTARMLVGGNERSRVMAQSSVASIDHQSPGKWMSSRI